MNIYMCVWISKSSLVNFVDIYMSINVVCAHVCNWFRDFNEIHIMFNAVTISMYLNHI